MVGGEKPSLTGHTVFLRSLQHLKQQPLGAAAAFRGVLAVTHLYARKTDYPVRSGGGCKQRVVSVTAGRIVVARGGFCGMRGSCVAPVDSCKLDAEANGGAECEGAICCCAPSRIHFDLHACMHACIVNAL
jgi:hypothetical protein